jgi:hypothetical protein
MFASQGLRDRSERKTAPHGLQPSEAVNATLSTKESTMTSTPNMTVQQASLCSATLTQTVSILRDPTRLGAWLCSELWEDGHHNGTHIRWRAERASRVTDRERARLRLRFEELGFDVRPLVLDEALLLTPPAPEGLAPDAFLDAQGGQA